MEGSIVSSITQMLMKNRHQLGIKSIIRVYLYCARKTARWWLQFSSLSSLIILLGFITYSFTGIYFNNQRLQLQGSEKLRNLELALQMPEQDIYQLVRAQKAVLNHIAQAKEANQKFLIVSLFGVDVERTRVCPYSKQLLASIKQHLVNPALNKFESKLACLAQEQISAGRSETNQSELAEHFKHYVSLTVKPDVQNLDQLAQTWCQTLDQPLTEQGKIPLKDIQLLLAYYFQRTSKPIETNESLIIQVQKQLEEDNG